MPDSNFFDPFVTTQINRLLDLMPEVLNEETRQALYHCLTIGYWLGSKGEASQLAVAIDFLVRSDGHRPHLLVKKQQE